MVFSTFCSQAQLKDNHNPKVPAPPMQKLSQKSMLSQLQPVILIQEILSFKQGNCTVNRKPPNISPGLIFVRKHEWAFWWAYTWEEGREELIYGGLIYGQDFKLVILTIY